MGSKRPAPRSPLNTPIKRPRLSGGSALAEGIPQARYRPHPDCRSGINFHSVPYPLDLLPYQSWCALHFRKLGPSGALEIQCPICAAPQPASTHHQKLFLVAERLLFDPERTPVAARQNNEEANWEVNFQLGILDPFVEDLEGHIPGGKRSRVKRCYPFETEFEMGAVLKLIEKGGVLTQSNWAVWRDMIDHLPLDGPIDAKSNGKKQSQAGRLSKADALPIVANNGDSTTDRTDLSWVSQLEEEDVAESHDHLHYLKPVLLKMNHAMAVHQAAGTIPPLSLIPSRKLIEDDIEGVGDIIRRSEGLKGSRDNSGTGPEEMRTLEDINVNSLLTPTSTPNPAKPTTSTSFPPTPPSSFPETALSAPPPPSNRHYTDPPPASASTSPSHLPTSSTLSSLYSSLDLLERTSPTATRFLEAYAEFLRWDMCGCCWFQEMIHKPDGVGELCGAALGKRPEWRVRSLVRETR
ncbi:MAG: hypothetical protein M1840_008460 [Geoglossum simile]|nr:MAG: hypothetical protein M1840_008460 [Geoglossum simile]